MYKVVGVSEVSKITGLNKNAIYNRIIRGGETLEEVLIYSDRDRKPKKKKTYRYNGVDYTTLQMAEETGLSVAAVRELIRTGHSIGEILSKKPLRRWAFKGKTYSLKEIAQLPECEISYQMLLKRIRDGWSLEDAVLTKSQRHPWKFKGKTYDSLMAISKLPECQVVYGTLVKRIREGQDIETAILNGRKRKG